MYVYGFIIARTLGTIVLLLAVKRAHMHDTVVIENVHAFIIYVYKYKLSYISSFFVVCFLNVQYMRVRK